LIKNDIFGQNLNKETYIMQYKRQLMSIIVDSKYSDSSKKSLLFMVARWLLNHNEQRYTKLFSQAGYEYKVKIENLEGGNQLDEKEIENIRPYQYFVDILDTINYDDITTQKDHYKYLLLSLLILQPPVRTSFYSSCKFIRTKEENDKENNFILINRRGKIKVSYIINDDKASGYKKYTIDKTLSIIPIVDESLAKLINDSFIKYPRKYLFEGSENKATSDSTLLSYLRSITSIKGITINMMRSIYVSKEYKTLSYGGKEKLANQMRHSVNTASLHYDKISNDEALPDNETIKILNTRIVNLELELKNALLKLSTYEESKDDAKKVMKKRKDILYLLKKGDNVKASTLLKYNIIKSSDGTYE
jgi:hypothetical protein